jgi:hypothetical protein
MGSFDYLDSMYFLIEPGAMSRCRKYPYFHTCHLPYSVDNLSSSIISAELGHKIYPRHTAFQLSD